MAKKPTPVAAPPSNQPNEDGTLIAYGNTVRMERDAAAKPDGEYLWTVYGLVPVTDGQHPHHGTETTEPAVWMPQGRGDEASARRMCEELSGITK